MDTLTLPIPVLQRAMIGAALPEIEEQARTKIEAMPAQMLAMLAASGMQPDAICGVMLDILEAISDGEPVTISIDGQAAIVIPACDMGI